MNTTPLTILARTNWGRDKRLFGIRSPDRRHHVYIVGQTGTGKTTLLEQMIRQDVVAGNGLALLDPHGDLARRVVATALATRQTDTILFDPADPRCPYRFNPLAGVSPGRRTVVVASLLESFEKLWSSAWGARLEHILRNTLLTLVETPGATFADIPRLFGDERHRDDVVRRVGNAQVRRFWEQEFPGYRSDALGPIMNKVGAFLADPLIHRVVATPGTALDTRAIIDAGHILIVNVAKGRIGGPNAALLGALILSRIELAALERVDSPEEKRRDFWVYLDEFQNFMTPGLASMLSELRKYRVGLILAHQFAGQLSDEIRKAIIGNVGTIIAFRVGLDDAKYVESLFSPTFAREDLVNLPNHEIYVRLMVEGRVSPPFSGTTLPPDRTA